VDKKTSKLDVYLLRVTLDDSKLTFTIFEDILFAGKAQKQMHSRMIQLFE